MCDLEKPFGFENYSKFADSWHTPVRTADLSTSKHMAAQSVWVKQDLVPAVERHATTRLGKIEASGAAESQVVELRRKF